MLVLERRSYVGPNLYANFPVIRFINKIILDSIKKDASDIHFEPFEKKNVEIGFGFKSLQTDIPVRLFKGDGDSDRPSEIQEYNE